MKIPCQEITESIKKNLIKRVKALKKKKKTPKLLTILIGESPAQLSFVAIKQRTAKEIGIKFEFLHLKETPEFLDFANLLKQKSSDKEITGIIIQQPLPSKLFTETLYNFINPLKEIEGHQNKTTYLPPLGLAVLTALKYVYQHGKISDHLIIDSRSDAVFFKNVLKHKRVVLVGRGITGGQPIGKTLSFFRINYINVNSITTDPDQYYKEADVIIIAVGKKVLTANNIKPGVILINAGLRRDKGKLKGDYDEDEIKNIASYYSTTPKGIGPIDVLYLYKNLIDSAEKQR